MGACRSYCSQGFFTTTRRIHGRIDHIGNENYLPEHNIWCMKTSRLCFFSGLGQPIAQGALELHCSFLQLKHHRTTMLRCDRKELRLFAPRHLLDI